jgi:hypothetical protein
MLTRHKTIESRERKRQRNEGFLVSFLNNELDVGNVGFLSCGMLDIIGIVDSVL